MTDHEDTKRNEEQEEPLLSEAEQDGFAIVVILRVFVVPSTRSRMMLA
jgi:hypothetical protein